MLTRRWPLGGFSPSAPARRRAWIATAATLGLAISWVEAAPPIYGVPKVRDLDTHITRAGGADPVATPRAEPSAGAPADPDAPRVASTSTRPLDPTRAHSTNARGDGSSIDPIVMAKSAIAECRGRYRDVHDYTCKFVKRERIEGRLTAPHIMFMKARTSPHSLYFKFQQPNCGREAIYIQGRNNGRIVAHDVGLGKLFAGTMYLDPQGSMAMEENRHPVTEAGIGSLIDTVARHWAAELTPGESVVTIHPDARAHGRPCTLIESVHPQAGPKFLFHKVRLFIDHEHGLPIRFEAYDWPRRRGVAPELVEEYAYLDLKTNVGLRDSDFDPSNRQYSFGRF